MRDGDPFASVRGDSVDVADKPVKPVKPGRCERCSRWPSHSRGCQSGTCEPSPVGSVRDRARALALAGEELPWQAPGSLVAAIAAHRLAALAGAASAPATPPPARVGEPSPRALAASQSALAREQATRSPTSHGQESERASHEPDDDTPATSPDGWTWRDGQWWPPATVVAREPSAPARLAPRSHVRAKPSASENTPTHDHESAKPRPKRASKRVLTSTCEPPKGGIPPSKGAREGTKGVGGWPASLNFPQNPSFFEDPFFPSSELGDLDALLSAEDDDYGADAIDVTPGACRVVVECSSGTERQALMGQLERDGWVAHKAEDWREG